MSSDKKHDIFISYSHAATGDVANGLQVWLQRYAKPWWQRKALNVFRDQTDLTVVPELWTSIVSALNQSHWLVLIATPDAARSKWVKRELRYWLGDDRSIDRPIDLLDDPISDFNPDRRDRLMIVLASGTLVWREASADADADFDWQHTDAIPKCLSRVFKGEPLWVDLRDVVKIEANRRSLDRSNPVFIGAVAQLSATVRNLSLSTLVGEDSRLHRRAMQTAWSAALALFFLALAAGIIAWLAILAARTADWQRQIAAAERTAAEARTRATLTPSQLPQAGLMARQAYIEMRRLSINRPLPEWTRGAVHSLVRLGVSSLEPVERATAYEANFQAVASANEVMRLADNLTPELVSALKETNIKSVTTAAILPDGKNIAYFPYGNELAWWSPQGMSLKPLSLPTPVSRVNGQANLALSGDGTMLAIETAEGIVNIYDTRAAKVTQTIQTKSTFPREAFLPRKKSGKESGAPITESFRPQQGEGQPTLAGLALDQHGERLMLISRSGFARLFAIAQAHLYKPIGRVWLVDIPDVDDFMRMGIWMFDSRGEYLAATPSSFRIGQAPVMVWHARDGTALHAPLIHDAGVNAIAFSADGTQMATGTQSGNVFLWDTKNGSRGLMLSMGTSVQSLAFGSAAAHGLLLVGGQGIARVYELTSGREIARAPQAGRVDTVAWTPEGYQFITGAVLNTAAAPLRLWNLDAALLAAPSRMQSANGLELLAYSGGALAAIGWPSELYVWDVATGALRQTFPSSHVIRMALVYNRVTERILTLAPENEGIAFVFDIKTGKRTTIPGEGLTTVSYSDHRPYIAIASFDALGRRLLRLVRQSDNPPCRLEVWDLESIKRIFSTSCPAETEDAVLSDDGNRIVWKVGGASPQVTAKLVNDEKSTWSLPLSPSKKSGTGKLVAFARDGSRIAVATGNTVQIFEASTGARKGSQLVLGAEIMNIALDAKGELVAAALMNRSLIVASSTTGDIISVHNFATDTLGSGSLVFSDDGLIYAVFSDSNINNPRVWRWRTNLNSVAEALLPRLAPIVAVEDLYVESRNPL